MFPPDRAQLRAFFAQTFRKWQANAPLEPLEALVAQVVAEHPEYHRLIAAVDSGEALVAADGEPNPNPFLHLSMHVALREQQSVDRPTGIHRLYTAIVRHRGDRHDAEHGMMVCLEETMWTAQANNRPPDEAAFLRCLRHQLPEEVLR